MAFSTVVASAAKIKGKGLKTLTGCYIALGRGNSAWDDVVTEAKTFAGNTISTVPNIALVEIRSSDDEETYVKNVDYSVNEVTGVVTRLIDGDIPNNAEVNVDYKILGKYSFNSTGLFDEIGRKKAAVDYVVLDASGSIELDGIKYSISSNPTNLIYCRTVFNTDEATDEDVRECGLFFGTIPDGVQTSNSTKTFAESQIDLLTSNIRNVVIKSNDNVTTYVEGDDYTVDYINGKVYRNSDGDITLTQTVKANYITDPEDYIDEADVADPGLFFGGQTFETEDRNSQGNWTKTFLISLTE